MKRSGRSTFQAKELQRPWGLTCSSNRPVWLNQSNLWARGERWELRVKAAGPIRSSWWALKDFSARWRPDREFWAEIWHNLSYVLKESSFQLLLKKKEQKNWRRSGLKNPPAKEGNIRGKGSVPGSGRSSGGGHGNLLEYSCLENPTDRGAWQVTVQRVAKSAMTEVAEHSGLQGRI